MERNLALEFVRVTEAAALASSRWMGRGNEKAADQAAIEAMRRAFNFVEINGTVVIGEGEQDEVPMLYTGEKVGTGHPPETDIALDALEGTTITALGGYNALSIIAAAGKGCILSVPDIYMEKIAVGPRAKGVINIEASPTQNLKAVAQALDCPLEDLTVVILDRPRHEALIREIRSNGARIRLIPDGDVSGAIATAMEGSGIDILMGIGGAPEGILAAAALKCLGGDMQGRLVFRNDLDKERARKAGIEDTDKIFTLEDMVRGEEVMFAATGVTDGDMLKGVRRFKEGAKTYSVVMRSPTHTIRFIQAIHGAATIKAKIGL
jgi:fructose-1,6-bisphosphatase II